MRIPRIYTASKIRHAPMWRKLRDEHRYNYILTARWIHKADGETDFNDLNKFTPNQIRLGWIEDIQDVRFSDWLIAYMEPEDHVRGSLVEVGAAIAYGVNVVSVGFDNHHSWQSHPLVTRAPDLDSAFQFITGTLP